MVMLLREIWVPRAVPPWCRFKVNMSPELQKRKFGNADISLSPCFVVSVSALFPKLCFGQTCFYGSEKNNSEKGCVPNTFQVCAKITREQNSSNKHYLEFLYRWI